MLFLLLGYVLLLHGWGDTSCTIPNPSHEKLRKQNALFLFFYGVPLPPPKGTKDQGRKLAPGTGKDIIAHCRAEPSGFHSCHGKHNGVVFKGKGITNEERRAAADGNCLAMVCAVTVRGLRKSRYHLFAPGGGIVRPHPSKMQKDQGRSC